MSKLLPTPSQTVGPYFSMKLEEVELLAGAEAPGQRIGVEGRVLDGDQEPVEDAMLEIWQADGAGRYRRTDDVDRRPAEGFLGYGRVHSDFRSGRFRFLTLKPGRVPDPRGGLQAPHLSLMLTARGLLHHLYTRLYFADEAEANAEDLVLSLVPEERRPTLIAEVDRSGEIPTYRFELKLHGDDETVFFDF